MRTNEITPAMITRYTEGQCHFLALAIHEITGWDVVLVTDDSAHSGHAMARTPDGRLVDIRGVHTADDLRAHCPVDVDGYVILDAKAHRAAGLPEPVAMPYVDAEWFGVVDGAIRFQPDPQTLLDARRVLAAYGLED